MLSDLPSELLLQTISDFSTANSVRSLSQCNQRLHQLVANEGWRTFVNTQYPSIVPPLSPPEYAEAAKALLALDNSWQRRALLSFYLEPAQPGDPPDALRHPPPARRAERQFPVVRPGRYARVGQTMGFQPVVDSREAVVGGRWRARRDVVAWGAGPRVVVRRGERAEGEGLVGGADRRVARWSTFLPEGAREGLDDVTALKLLASSPDAGSTGAHDVSLFVGTAAGKVAVFELDAKVQGEAKLRREFKFQTGSTTPVRSMDVTASERFGVAGLASGDVFLLDMAKSEPVSTLKMSKTDHIWATKFLSPEYVAIGTGQSDVPLKVFSIDSAGFSESPLRTWDVHDGGFGDAIVSPDPAAAQRRACSIACIEAVPPTSGPGNAGGRVFFTGSSDGKIRIHDLRSPAECNMEYFDPVDDGSIYSIATKGSNYLIAGSSRHSLLKMFDIRKDGNHPSETPLWILPEHGPAPQPRPSVAGWSVHLHQDGGNAAGRSSSIGTHMRNGRATRSPVYALSSPSPFSPTLYAGLEDHVAQIDIVDVYEKHLDSVFGRPRGGVGTDVRCFWDQQGRSRIQSYYEHRSPNKLRMQDQWPDPRLVKDRGYDIRWRELAPSPRRGRQL
jgi:WD40 repeat protein